MALLGLGKSKGDVIWPYASAVRKLPKGRYVLDPAPSPEAGYWAALGWALGTYRFQRYKSKAAKKLPSLVWPEGVDRKAIQRAVEATTLTRDLVNTPAGDLGPAELADQAEAIAETYGAEIELTVGEQLVADNYPSIYAVGKGCPREPRLIDIRWGDEEAPKVSLVGKGVRVRHRRSQPQERRGHEAHEEGHGRRGPSVLALAQMIMDAKLPVRLRVLVPAVENAISGSAFHPLDVLQTRKGITIEVGHTDAEGRLILCDALAEADSENPEVLIDFATLTGAARVALGTELPAMFCNDDELAAEILASGESPQRPPVAHAPVSLLPAPPRQPDRGHQQRRQRQPGRRDHGGLVPQRVRQRPDLVGPHRHDGLQPPRASGRPVGGEAFGVRAMFDMLSRRYAAS